MTESVPEPAGSGEGVAEGAVGTAPAPAPATTRPVKRDWRGQRPFWGGLLVLFGGAEILFTLRAPLPVVLHIGMQGLAGYLVPAVMVLCGLLILFNPAQRLFYSILAVLAALASWLTSNLGGFVIGMLLGLVGACLTFGWLPDQPLRRGRQRREDRRQERRSSRAGTAGAGADPAGV
ncbi:DUF6114 domain-containing protein [Kitasatospora sp. NBC_01300]|uniref:DUF6114 domain-containing protein n=1 Tax=Kitasatospora sp. NBC_01300 TaxID=2903574 RepID=UPI00352D1DF3|nr:DUF6114 domain-containing protein [Kitasatospora sp. NBC_01300]